MVYISSTVYQISAMWKRIIYPLLKPYNLFYSDGVAILSGFHDIWKNISVGFTDVINQVKDLGQLQGQGQETWKSTTGDLREHVCTIWL